MLKDDGYPDVQAFIAAYLKAEALVEEYNRALAEWERQARVGRKPAGKGKDAPPERESVRSQLRRIQAEGRQRDGVHSWDRER